MSQTVEQKMAAFRALLERYRRLPRRQHVDCTATREQLRSLQVAGLLETHKAFDAQKQYRALKTYYIEHLHSGVDLERVIKEGELVLRIVSRLHETYDLVMNALEFSVTAQELDDAVLQSFDKTSERRDLAVHVRKAGQLKARSAHAQLIRPLGPGLAPYTRSRLSQAAFKLAMTPLRATGLAPLVVVLDKGFDVLRGLDDVEGSFDQLISNNLLAIKQLYSA